MASDAVPPVLVASIMCSRLTTISNGFRVRADDGLRRGIAPSIVPGCGFRSTAHDGVPGLDHTAQPKVEVRRSGFEMEAIFWLSAA